MGGLVVDFGFGELGGGFDDFELALQVFLVEGVGGKMLNLGLHSKMMCDYCVLVNTLKAKSRRR